MSSRHAQHLGLVPRQPHKVVTPIHTHPYWPAERGLFRRQRVPLLRRRGVVVVLVLAAFVTGVLLGRLV